jgi:hypothetical protein
MHLQAVLSILGPLVLNIRVQLMQILVIVTLSAVIQEQVPLIRVKVGAQ